MVQAHTIPDAPSLSTRLKVNGETPNGLPATHGPLPLAAAFKALCAVARLHQIAADADTLAHQLGARLADAPGTADILLAAKHLGLKAKSIRITVELAHTPLPALARMRGLDGSEHIVMLVRCDAQRVLLRDFGASNSRQTIESIDVFSASWTGELLLITCAGAASANGEPIIRAWRT